MRTFTAAVCVGLLCLGLATQALANMLELEFTADHLYCAAGESATFYGAITNNTDRELRLLGHSDSSSVAFAAMGGHADGTPDPLRHVPWTLTPHEVWTGPLLLVTTTTSVIPDTYGATRDLSTFYREVTYGDGGTGYTSRKAWVLTVTAPAPPPVPEPSAIILALGGLGALIGLRRRR